MNSVRFYNCKLRGTGEKELKVDNAVIRGADMIIVLDEGHIAGTGTDKELRENCEVYREICASQPDVEEEQ